LRGVGCDWDWQTVRDACSTHGRALRQEATELAVRTTDLSAAHAWQKELAENPETSHLAVMATGVIGDSFSVPWLIEQMKIQELSRARENH